MSTFLTRMAETDRPPISQTLIRVCLGGFMSFAGLAHLTFAREEFQAQVPDRLPISKDVVVVGSGIAEVGLGVALLSMPRFRRLTGISLASFYAMVFPGNIAQYAERTDAFGLNTDTKRLIRLFGQPVLIAAALWAAGIPKSHH